MVNFFTLEYFNILIFFFNVYQIHERWHSRTGLVVGAGLNESAAARRVLFYRRRRADQL